MATTHDMQYEGERRSSWAWLIPLAILLLAAFALLSFLNNDNTLDNGLQGTTPAVNEQNMTQ